MRPLAKFDIVTATQTETDWVTLVVLPQALNQYQQFFWGSEKVGFERLEETIDGVLYRLRTKSPIVARSGIELREVYPEPEPVVENYRYFFAMLRSDKVLPDHKIEQLWAVNFDVKAGDRLAKRYESGTIEFEIVEPYQGPQNPALIRTVGKRIFPSGQWALRLTPM